MTDLDSFPKAVKQSVWGNVPAYHDEFYHGKFDSNGDVVPGWNAEKWMLGITGGWKSSTRGCHTATYQSAAK